jgi:hypothetical protein
MSGAPPADLEAKANELGQLSEELAAAEDRWMELALIAGDL